MSQLNFIAFVYPQSLFLLRIHIDLLYRINLKPHWAMLHYTCFLHSCTAPTSPPIGFTFELLNSSLSWQPPLGYERLHEQYALWYYLLLEDRDRGTESIMDTDLTSFLFEDLEPGTHYCVSVRAVSSGGYGVYSEKECFNTTAVMLGKWEEVSRYRWQTTAGYFILAEAYVIIMLCMWVHQLSLV